MGDSERQYIDLSKNNNNNQFICGVVEGFYGKPWTYMQRKDLFKRLKDLNLNSFMYAPKEDAKHRAKWRQLYDKNEERDMRMLIEEAAANSIDFYYSLAPGLDMTYSNQDDTSVLNRKFDQLRKLGCKCFAILFDDIEPSITNQEDKAVFDVNYAAAQVSVTNQLYHYLEQPKFLFCPTEYCESRAVPNVKNSLYLNTIGEGLHPGIDIMWSGSRVVSRYITEESIQALSAVIRRPPLIWENLHANDYDKRRVYLGPYSGRSTKIIPQLRGVLTNPNCEYEVNYIAIHTLAQWSKCTEDINPHNRCNQAKHVPIEQCADNVYDPDRALTRAIRDWLPLVLSNRSLPQGTEASSLPGQRSDEPASEQLTKGELHDIDAKADMDENVIEMRANIPSPDNATSTSKSSEMDTSCSPAPLMVDTNSCDSCEMRDDSNENIVSSFENQAIGTCLVCSSIQDVKLDSHTGCTRKLDSRGLEFLIDFFYLPFEHGLQGHAFLKDFQWLIENSEVMLHGDGHEIAQDTVGPRTKEEAVASSERILHDTHLDRDKSIKLWTGRADKLQELCVNIDLVVNTLLYKCPNKIVAAELCPYLIDLRGVIGLISDYLRFLRNRKSILDRFFNGETQDMRPKEPASSDDQEPWIHRGGFIGDVHRLLI